HATAATAAAAAWLAPLPDAGRAIAAAAAWLALIVALPPLQRRLAALPPLAPWWRPLGALSLDLAGWALGLLALVVWQRAGWGLAALVLAACAVAAAEAGRQRRLRQQAESGRAALEQLGRAG